MNKSLQPGSRPQQATVAVQRDGGAWSPVEGPELNRLLANEFRNIDDEETMADRSEVRNSALEILKKCVGPESGPPESRTGLVCGYVQSGKTLSFTSVIAAARDNHFRLVILLAGSSKNLHNQNSDRLQIDLGGDDGHTRPWHIMHVKDARTVKTRDIEATLHGWKADPEEAKTIVISILKHQSKIRKIADVLRKISPVTLGTVLIIDDEADYASLNTRAKRPTTIPSAINASIIELRSALERHTYLQYTATPQAPIFVHLGDRLSPDFCQVLKPGHGYLGGKYFFKQHSKKVVTIDAKELPANYSEEEIPTSLEDALREFLLGVAVGLLNGDKKNRSMMVHPASKKVEHARYTVWISQVTDQWWQEFDDIDGEDWEDFITPFESAYAKLTKLSEGPLPDFSELKSVFPKLRNKCRIKELNEKEIITKTEWRQFYAWILIGGFKLDRGLTVEGLTVTYIPRGPGQANADTLQQRARFFGYKKSYSDLIRIYMPIGIKNRFTKYVESEENMRNFLLENSDLGRLRNPEVIRRFQLDRSMRPCRSNVIVDYPRRKSASWVNQSNPIANLEVEIDDNLIAVDNFVRHKRARKVIYDSKCEWLTTDAAATPARVHEVIGPVSLREFYEDLLTRIQLKGERDFMDWSLGLTQIEDYLAVSDGDQKQDPPDAFVIKIAPNYKKSKQEAQFRTLNAKNEIPTIPSSRSGGYRGDDAVKKGIATLQVYKFDLRSEEGFAVARDVTVIRLWLDGKIIKDYIEQDNSN